MYWFKKIANKKVPSLRRGVLACAMAGRCYTAICFFALLLPACKPDIKETGTSGKYFDLQGYFKTEVAKLSKLPDTILKTVIHNGVAESKRVKIDNWPRELNLFVESDINKPAWRDSYKIQQTDHTTIYMATDTTIKTREIIINKKDDKVAWIIIYNFTKNILYTNREKLTYVPDSMYKIEKTQHVKLLGINRYAITGFLKQ